MTTVGSKKLLVRESLVTGVHWTGSPKQKHRPNRQKMTENCVFSPLWKIFGHFFGHFFDIFRHFVDIPFFVGCPTICPLQRKSLGWFVAAYVRGCPTAATKRLPRPFSCAQLWLCLGPVLTILTETITSENK